MKSCKQVTLVAITRRPIMLLHVLPVCHMLCFYRLYYVNYILTS